MRKYAMASLMALVMILSLFSLPALAEEFELNYSTPPGISDPEIVQDGDAAWLQIRITTPGSVLDLIEMLSFFDKDSYISGIQISYSLDGGEARQADMTYAGTGTGWNGVWKTDVIPGLAEASRAEVCARYVGEDENGSPILSDWSNTLTLGGESGEGRRAAGEAAYSAHDWAKPELKDADGMGLIPENLRSEDLTLPITRAEFAAVSVKAYEAISGETLVPVSLTPFDDTANPEVLKALAAGITNGLSKSRFAPEALLNREQAATMLTRVYKKYALEGWTLETDGDYADAFRALFTMPEPFADDADISSWARDSVYFMAANGVLNGVGNNCFAPKLVTSGEETLNHATREQAILIAVRLVKNLSGS